MYQEPGLADEVVVVFVDSEIVNCLLAGVWGDGRYHAPLAADGLQAVAYAHLAGWRPLGWRVGALDKQKGRMGHPAFVGGLRVGHPPRFSGRRMSTIGLS